MDVKNLRAWWSCRQGLDGSLGKASPVEVLARSGWARSVGGAGPYLTLHARAGIGRERADAAAAKLEIHELPSARGCTYVVPSSDFALALLVGRGHAEAPIKQAMKLGVTDKEIRKLCDAIVKALTSGPLDPEQIRGATGSASRSLGPEGAKKGITTTLPLALGRLQETGDIRRVPTNGRLDQQRYRYSLWKPSPLAKSKLTPEEAFIELARRYFRWIGPATVAEFQAFAGLGVKAAKAAVEPLRLVPLDAGSERLMAAEDLEALRAFKVPKEPRYALVSGLDAIVLLRRDHRTLLDPADAKRKVVAEKALGTIGGLADLPSHAILDRGRLVGLWEFDIETGSIAWAAFVPKNRELSAAVDRTATWVRDDLGDARSFSLDSPKSRAPRIEALRKAQAPAP
jgi:hypothetical protein